MAYGLAIGLAMFLICFGGLKYIHQRMDNEKRWEQTSKAAAPPISSWLNFA